MGTRSASSADEQLRTWWTEHSTTTALLASSQLLWPTFLEWADCVFWVPPFSGIDEWKAYLVEYGPHAWVSLPLAERRIVAAQLGEQPLSHLARVHVPSELDYAGDMIQELFLLICVTWPKALSDQFPGRTFSVTEVDRGDGLTIRLAEL